MAALASQISDWLIVGLTPVQRWEAARRLDSGFSVYQWVIMGGAILLVALSAGFVFVSLKRRAVRKEAAGGNGFHEQAVKRGLSEREARIAHYVAMLAGLSDHGAILTVRRAFDLGSAALMQQGPSSGMNAEQVAQLKSELDALREKLGFQERPVDSSMGGADASRPTSRAIPEGKTLFITRRTNRNVADVEAIVIQNTNSGITLKLPMPINAPVGEQWRVRCYYGASVWEFDVPVIRNDGIFLILAHNDNIRFINRRRFVRVPVSRRAYLTRFAFEKELAGGTAKGASTEQAGSPAQDVLPTFTEAVVTELAGPGLRIESSLELEVGERVAVVFELRSEPDLETDDEGANGRREVRLIQAVGDVRHVQAAERGFSAAVELVGLSDADINELTRATNDAARNSANEEPQEETSEVPQDSGAAITS
jgi:hypothetical protein